MELLTLLLVLIAVGQLSFLLYRSQAVSSHSFKARPVFIDTSALMDGRIITAAATGFISERIVIPTSVVAELQLLADKADGDKRAKARRGLDAITELQALDYLSVEILNDGPLDEGGVDQRLVQLAKKYHGHICTIDFNLNKVAQVEKVFVLNVNELAQSMRMAYLPGERLSLELIQKGQDSHQGVGYLADGTMVVVEQAAKQIGDTVEVEFIRSLQTAAGRMMFAKKVAAANTSKSNTNKHKSNGRKETKQPRSSSKTNREDSLIELVNRQR